VAAPAVPTTPASPPDTTPPALLAAATESAAALNNQWQSTTRQPRFTWEPAMDTGSGVAGYHVYWGPDPAGTAANFTATPDYAPADPICAADETATWYLRVQPVDNARNHGPWQTLFTLRYDGQAPTGALAINAGQPDASTPNVTLHLTAQDEGSGVAEMRLRNEDAEWSEWGPYRDRIPWRLPDGEGRRTVEAQFRDEAGNVSPAYTASIDVQFITAPPSSANYRLVRSVAAIGGGRKTSASYALNATTGQSAASGSTRSSANYRLRSGFWGPGRAGDSNYKLYLPLVLKG